MRSTSIVFAGMLVMSGFFPFSHDMTSHASEEKEEKLRLKPIKGRPGKLLHQALYAKDGRLGFLQDVDVDGIDDFVHLVQKGSQLSFRIMSPLDGTSRIDNELGKGYPAGLGVVNLDDDEPLEFIAAYGSRRDRLAKKALAIVSSAVVSGYASYQSASTQVFTYSAGEQGLDLQHLIAFDDDGSTIWHRDLKAEETAGGWDNIRFRMLLPLADNPAAMIVLTNNVGPGVIGISGTDGSTVWTTGLQGPVPPAKWASAGLLDDGRILPVLFHQNDLTVFDPRDGRVLVDDHLDLAVSALPAWHTFGKGPLEGFLVFGDSRNELRMLSLGTGETLWSRDMEKVRAVLALDEETFMVIWRHGVRKLSSDGEVLLDAATPFKVKTVFDPVFKDLDGDGSFELVFTSGKKIVCWNPERDEVLWRESLASFVGGANPVALYDAFHDLNRDGWLDVPAATGGAAGRWLSGRTGQVIAEVGAALENPLVGDWDEDGQIEFFWWKNWHEIHPKDKKGK